tara:strand:+ start:436 stop:1119 length:684 start_codon:yes stop_codon:yes gene_type:complete
MKLAALFSGGKDSTFAIHLAKKSGHSVDVLLTLFPHNEESWLWHYPNIRWTGVQAQSMNIPQLTEQLISTDPKNEFEALDRLILSAKENYSIEGIVHGGILSKYQKDNFSLSCKKNNLEIISPLWNMEPESYMNELLSENFEYIISAVSSAGLDFSWLGRTIQENDLIELKRLQKKFDFNLNFEGGEAETFVINCPLFKKPITIVDGIPNWDGYRGSYYIHEISFIP